MEILNNKLVFVFQEANCTLGSVKNSNHKINQIVEHKSYKSSHCVVFFIKGILY